MATAAAEFTYKFSDKAKVTVKYISESCLPTGEVSAVGERGRGSVRVPTRSAEPPCRTPPRRGSLTMAGMASPPGPTNMTG